MTTTTAGTQATAGSKTTTGLPTQTPTTAGMLAKVVKLATACREANNNMDTINIRDNSSSSREASNIQQVRQQQQQEIKTIVEYWQQLCSAAEL
jgi:hypothetical protein